MTKSTSGGCDQFEISPEANDQELRTAFCQRRQTDILMTNYRIDLFHNAHICIMKMKDIVIKITQIRQRVHGVNILNFVCKVRPNVRKI